MKQSTLDDIKQFAKDNGISMAHIAEKMNLSRGSLNNKLSTAHHDYLSREQQKDLLNAFINLKENIETFIDNYKREMD